MLIDRLLIQKSQTHTSARCSSGPDVTGNREPQGWGLGLGLSNVKPGCSSALLTVSPEHLMEARQNSILPFWKGSQRKKIPTKQSETQLGERGSETRVELPRSQWGAGLTGPWGWATLHLAAGWNPEPVQNLPQRFLMKYELVSSPRTHVWAMSTSGFPLFENVRDISGLRNPSFSVLPPCWFWLWFVRQESQAHCVTSTDSFSCPWGLLTHLSA